MPVDIVTKIKPKNNGQFPTYDDIDGYGGYQVRGTIADRNAIPALNRKAGMLVYVQADTNYYQLGVGLTNSDWAIANLGNSGSLAGDVTGAIGSNSVTKINGATVPVAGSLTTGNVPQVSGSSALTYAPVNLAGGANFVTGSLPAGNQANQTMVGDVTGTTAASVVAKLQTRTVATDVPTDGYVLTWQASSTSWKPLPSDGSSLRMIAASNLTIGQVIRTDSLGHATPVTSNFNLPLYGICLSNISTATVGFVQVAGPLNPTIYNLGIGAACAVGINSSGMPVRSTDPTCSSPKNWIGVCDANGNINIQPFQRAFLFATDYGAVAGDSSSPIRSQNIAAFRAMIGSITSFDQDEIRWPHAGTAAPFYLGTDPRVFSSVTHTGTGTGTITPSGTPATSDWGIKIIIKAGNNFRYSFDNGVTDNGSDIPIPGSPFTYVIPVTGITITFSSSGTWVAADVYQFNGWRPTALQLTRPVRMYGAGGRASFGTVFKIPDGVTGLRAWQFNVNPIGPDTSSDAEGSLIDGFFFWAEGTSDITAHGIDTRTLLRANEVTCLAFGGNGFHVTSDGGIADNCRFDWCNAYQCQNGAYVKGGDSNLTTFYSCAFLANRMYGFQDRSFLGANWIVIHTAENMVGPNYMFSSGSSSQIGVYSEGDQPPSIVDQGQLYNIGGQQSSGYQPGSAYFGGSSPFDLYPSQFTSRAGTRVTATGTTPPAVVLSGNVISLPANIRIECTTQGYPGGYDSYHTLHGGQVAVFRWSVDGGSTYTSGFSPTRADQNAVFGNSILVLGSTGLTAFFTPYFYSTDNVYVSVVGAGGSQTYLAASSNDGSQAVYKYGHTLPANAGNDTAEHRFVYQPGNGRWENTWANTRTFLGGQVAGGRGLPFPGTETSVVGLWSNDDTWTANERHNLVGWADGNQVLGSAGWISSLTSRTHWFSPGDLILNRSQTKPWPLGWRASISGGWSGPGASGTGWSSGAGMFPGYSIEVGGFLYRSNGNGNLSVGSLPANYASHQTIGSNFTDGNCLMVCMGTVGNPFEPVGSVSEKTLTKDCSAGGTITLSYNGAISSTTDNSAYNAYLLNGSPAAAFTLIIDAGAAGVWNRRVENATGKDVTVKASGGDTGILLPTGAARMLHHDGTNITDINGPVIEKITEQKIYWAGGLESDGYALPFTHQVRDGYVTTNATTTTATTYSVLVDGDLVEFETKVVAKRLDVIGDAAIFILRGAWLRQGSSLTVVDDFEIVKRSSTPGAGAWTAALDITSGTSIRVQVTGESGKVIHWSLVRETLETS